MNINNLKIAIIGLGYVGLPLFVEFSKKFKTIGFDTNKKRITDLISFKDSNKEFDLKKIPNNKKLLFAIKEEQLNDSNIYIITVPTPVTKNNIPDFTFLKNASKLVALKLNIKNIVIFESTVYPGAIEEICVPILERYSKLTFNKDFFVGYSPERINPGDNLHTLTSIKKITSGSNQNTALIVDKLYKSIIKAGTHKTKSIKIAEAAKVIENCQRDINIAFMNELSIIFSKMNLSSKDIFEAASTKWNFLNFKPGLVGGHCISVDPYYLSYASKKIGYEPKVILSGREINDSIPNFIVKNVINQLLKKNIKIKKSKILILGLSFKENCNDVRNSKVFDIYHNLCKKAEKVDLYDPLINTKDILNNYNININTPLKNNYYDIIIIAVAHKKFKKMGMNKILKYRKSKGVLIDLKNLFENNKNIDWSL